MGSCSSKNATATGGSGDKPGPAPVQVSSTKAASPEPSPYAAVAAAAAGKTPTETGKSTSDSRKDAIDSAPGIPGEIVELQPRPDQYDKEKGTLESNLGVLMAVNRLQRTARRKKALKVARAEQQWKMFADLDTQDEAEMLHLAVFMQTLIDSVKDPNDEKEDRGKDAFELTEEDNEVDVGVIRLESIELKDGHRGSFTTDSEYDVGPGKIDSKVAAEIVEVYRHGGKVSRKTVVKILRRAYKMLQKQKNVTRLSVPPGAKLNVIGDLHGQLSDLLYILDEAGLPNTTNRFIFNGDFVDRGDKGLEIVVILFTLFVAEGPEFVCLNRGNHEDLPVCRVYGFEGEVKAKYDELLFEMFSEVFNYLPLFALANDSLFVVHGGLFHTPQVTINELDEIVRHDYYVKPPVPYPQNIKGLDPASARKEFMKQLQRDALWSDPTDEEGCYLNPRGAGVSFGPDLASAFMEKNNIDMVVRSHECVFHGFDLPYASDLNPNGPAMGINGSQKLSDLVPDGTPSLCTLFSASNYIGGDNEGAFMIFLTHKFTDSCPVGGKSDLHYAVKRYKTTQASAEEIEDNNHMSLRELILKRKGALASAFEAADTENLGFVSRGEWADIMQRVTQIKIRWLSIITSIAPAESLMSTSNVDYKKFLAHFSVVRNDSGVTIDNEAQIGAMDDMYGQRKKLETVFYFFDSNGDGMISLDEFREGCKMLNANLHPDYQLTNIEHTLAMMDFDGSGTIDINEFFETFRILDAKDGKVDGVISLAESGRPPTQSGAAQASLR